MHSFIKAEAFAVRVVETGVRGVRHLLWIVETLEGHVFGFGQRFDEFENGAERVADPGNDDGPAFNAAVAVNALLERSELQDFVHGKFSRSFYVALNGNGPRLG